MAKLDALDPEEAPPPARERASAAGDCSTAYAPRALRDPTPMCKVTGGTFMMGGPVDPSLTPVYSPHPVPVRTEVGDYYIDQLAVSFGQAALFLNAYGNVCDGPRANRNKQCVFLLKPHDYPAELKVPEVVQRNGRFVVEPAAARDDAMRDFTQLGAIRYCAWVGKRLPTNAEWEYAARHDPASGHDRRYAWGDTWDAGAGPSPWGLHDVSGGVTEFVMSCPLGAALCSPGRRCDCELLRTQSHYWRPEEAVTYARTPVTYASTDGVRCLSPAK